jgi:hypothetical protein
MHGAFATHNDIIMVYSLIMTTRSFKQIKKLPDYIKKEKRENKKLKIYLCWFKT